jgi:hypothetical protein
MTVKHLAPIRSANLDRLPSSVFPDQEIGAKNSSRKLSSFCASTQYLQQIAARKLPR